MTTLRCYITVNNRQRVIKLHVNQITERTICNLINRPTLLHRKLSQLVQGTQLFTDNSTSQVIVNDVIPMVHSTLSF